MDIHARVKAMKAMTDLPESARRRMLRDKGLIRASGEHGKTDSGHRCILGEAVDDA